MKPHNLILFITLGNLVLGCKTPKDYGVYRSFRSVTIDTNQIQLYLPTQLYQDTTIPHFGPDDNEPVPLTEYFVTKDTSAVIIFTVYKMDDQSIRNPLNLLLSSNDLPKVYGHVYISDTIKNEEIGINRYAIHFTNMDTDWSKHIYLNGIVYDKEIACSVDIRIKSKDSVQAWNVCDSILKSITIHPIIHKDTTATSSQTLMDTTALGKRVKAESLPDSSLSISISEKKHTYSISLPWIRGDQDYTVNDLENTGSFKSQKNTL